MEGLTIETKPAAEKPADAWKEKREGSPNEARTVLVAHELPLDIEGVSGGDLERLLAKLPALIKELSYDANGAIRNENRFVVRELSLYLAKAQAFEIYKKIPSPVFLEAA